MNSPSSFYDRIVQRVLVQPNREDMPDAHGDKPDGRARAFFTAWRVHD